MRRLVAFSARTGTTINSASGKDESGTSSTFDGTAPRQALALFAGILCNPSTHEDALSSIPHKANTAIDKKMCAERLTSVLPARWLNIMSCRKRRYRRFVIIVRPDQYFSSSIKTTAQKTCEQGRPTSVCCDMNPIRR